jgi:hypothetical protein
LDRTPSGDEAGRLTVGGIVATGPARPLDFDATSGMAGAGSGSAVSSASGRSRRVGYRRPPQLAQLSEDRAADGAGRRQSSDASILTGRCLARQVSPGIWRRHSRPDLIGGRRCRAEIHTRPVGAAAHPHVGYGLLVLGVGLLGLAAVPEAPPPAPASLRVQGRASAAADPIGRRRIVLALGGFLPLADPQ